MPLGKSKKRRKSGNFRSGGRRKSYSVKQSRRIKSLGVLRVVLPILIILVLAAGIGIPLCVYFAQSSETPYASLQEQEEYFTDEQQQELLKVINKANPLDKEYVPELAEAESFRVNVLAQKALGEMLKAAEEASVNLQISQGYISYEEQDALYNEMYSSIKEQNNFTSIKAEAQTVKLVPKAGQSEAQTGLLIVFSDKDEEDFSKSRSFSWLSENAVNYGFVLRYPKDKEDVTSMSYNPSVYRFVGQKNALQMRMLGMCLEEFADYTAQK